MPLSLEDNQILRGAHRLRQHIVLDDDVEEYAFRRHGSEIPPPVYREATEWEQDLLLDSMDYDMQIQARHDSGREPRTNSCFPIMPSRRHDDDRSEQEYGNLSDDMIATTTITYGTLEDPSIRVRERSIQQQEFDELPSQAHAVRAISQGQTFSVDYGGQGETHNIQSTEHGVLPEKYNGALLRTPSAPIPFSYNGPILTHVTRQVSPERPDSRVTTGQNQEDLMENNDREWDTLDLLQCLQHDERALMHERTHTTALNHSIPCSTFELSMEEPVATSHVMEDTHEGDHEPSPFGEYVVSPLEEAFSNLMDRDPGFAHAQRAGIVWQSLASQHVRFPRGWWKGHRSPPLGVEGGHHCSWRFLGRHRVGANPILNERLVLTRGAAGRLLLHLLVVGDSMNSKSLPLWDIAVGCFHPNARGIRSAPRFIAEHENCRDVWLALRNRDEQDPSAQGGSLIESLLTRDGHQVDASPLGHRKAVHNGNLRAVYGELPPVHSLVLQESELCNILRRPAATPLQLPPALLLLQEYLSADDLAP